jgi:Alw26I/Eco31I/Esp3I family type II restriction m6 adenine DNA methyltransferase
MNHISTITNEVAQLQDKSLLVRAMGKFYTPDFIAERLSSHLVYQLDFSKQKRLSIIEPFCGDGRLLISFLRQAVKLEYARNVHWRISLWDYDAEAIKIARCNLEEAIASLEIDAEIDAVCRDSFLVPREEYGQYEYVITNPPWDTLKPDSREMAGMSPEAEKEYRLALKSYDQQLADILPNSQPGRKYGGWGTNLSRSGVELALLLTRPGYFCGVVTPMTLFGDQISSRLRHWIFKEAEPYAIDYYPAEAKLFDGVDQETIAISLRKHKSNSFQCVITAFDRNKQIHSLKDLKASYEALKSIDYCIPVKHGEVALNLNDKWQHFPCFEHLEGSGNRGVWIGRELDETGYKDYVIEQGRYKFLKGRMIGRFEIIEDPTHYVSEELKRIPDTVSLFRLVWRDVSRRSQARRMQAALIPPGMVTGNSLNVLHVNSNDLQKLQVLVAIMNSIPFEFQVRSRLGTGHISASVVRKIHLPSLDSNPYLERIPEFFEGLRLKTPSMERSLEIIVAKAYELSHDEYRTLLDNSDGLTTEYKSTLLANWDRF